MRIRDALSAMKAGKPAEKKKSILTTVWSEKARPGEAPGEYPRPQMYRKDWICLNGYWHYAFTENGSRPEVFDGKILVPFSPECRRSGVERQLTPGAYLWYFRSVELPRVPEGRRLLLHFGAVDERCIVWWNGHLAGSHLGGYLPFSFDVTREARDGKNTIWVRVQDDTDGGTASRGKQKLRPGGMFYTAQSGIWQTVWLELVPENFIEQIKVTPLFDEGQIRLEAALAEPADVAVLIQGEWTSYEHHLRREEFCWQEQDPAMACLRDGVLTRRAVATAVIDLPELHGWSPEDPFLYDLVLTTGEDQVQSYFAMRKFSVGADRRGRPRLMLNNQPYFFNGVLDQGYWPESLYTPPADAAMVYDISEMKKLGFNTLRKHVKVEPLRWYYHCDRLGMVVWQDMVNGGGRINEKLLTYLPNIFPSAMKKIKDSHYRLFARSEERARQQWTKECVATVELLYNCPCIAMWIPFNEGWGQFDSLKITELIRQKDSSRLIDHASGWCDQGGGDIRSEHNYFRPLRVKRDKRPFVLSEYGGYSCSVEGHTYTADSYGYRSFRSQKEFAAAFGRLSRKIHILEKRGLSGAVYTQLSDVEEENNGLCTFDRKKIKI